MGYLGEVSYVYVLQLVDYQSRCYSEVVAGVDVRVRVGDDGWASGVAGVRLRGFFIVVVVFVMIRLI